MAGREDRTAVAMIGRPVADVAADVCVEAQGDRADVLGRRQGQGEQEVAPGEEEREQPGGDERVAAHRQHDRRRRRGRCPAPSTRAASTIEAGMLPMNARMRMIANGMPAAESARISPRDGVEQPEVAVGAVQRVGDDDPGHHLGDEHAEEHAASPTGEPERGPGRRPPGVAMTRLNTTAPRLMTSDVTRLRPCSEIGGARSRRSDGSTGEPRRRDGAAGRLQGDVDHPVQREQHEREDHDADDRVASRGARRVGSRQHLAARRVDRRRLRVVITALTRRPPSG